MAGNERRTGPAGRRVAENLRIWRKRRGLTTVQLEERLGEIGWHILESGISRTEGGTRAVAADDLMSYAVALDVPPTTLLMPPAQTTLPLGDVIELTPSRLSTLGSAWAWMTGERSLSGTDDVLFVARNRPHRFCTSAAVTAATTAPAVGIMAGALRDSIAAGVPADSLRDVFEVTLAAALQERRPA
jgi:transcriptional regulator with XRE-family HTH domain